MKIVKFEEVRNEVINNFRRDMMIPIIGSGFTRNCDSVHGKVPSGNDYKKHMSREVAKKLKLNETQEQSLLANSFSRISTYYHKTVSIETRKEFLFENFTGVALDDLRKSFLSINWPYIYTLNIDDGIENNSAYSFIIYSNRQVWNDAFSRRKCVIKLHGDVAEMLAYADSHSEIFTQEQYIKSLQENTSLLNKLRHDMQFQNIIFVGCSLDDEIDLLACASSEGINNTSAKYFCTTSEPDVLESIKLEQYGITHCIVFDTFEAIYEELNSAYIEASKIQIDDLDPFRSATITHLPSDFDVNKGYLLFGKSLIGKNREITFPYFFISRETTDVIFSKIPTTPLQFVLANGCSGCSYVAVDIASRIRDRDVYIFETKDRISEKAFSLLLHKQNCVIIADCESLSNGQIEQLIMSRDTLVSNGSSAVVFAGKNNRDLANVFQLLQFRGVTNLSELTPMELSNHFTAPELDKLNPLLVAVGAGVFQSDRTVVDNIINIADTLREKNKFHKISPRLNGTREIAALIALATEKKLYSNRVVQLDILSEIESQQKSADPLIERESTWSFEKSLDDNSPTKYVLSAEFWLYRQLEKFAGNERNHQKIVSAYKYIVGKIIAQEGMPNLAYNNRDASYKEYIMFDNINRIFFPNEYSGSLLIQKIYDGLNDLLASDPNYMHQRAKCRIKMACKSKNKEQKKAYLGHGYRDAGVALQVFQERYKQQGNEKIAISVAHVMYTRALILCHTANVKGYEDININTEAIRVLYLSLKSPYNTYAFAKNDSYNYRNVIQQTIVQALHQKDRFSPDVYTFVEELFRMISEDERESASSLS